MSKVHKFSIINADGKTNYELAFDALPTNLRDRLLEAALHVVDEFGSGHLAPDENDSQGEAFVDELLDAGREVLALAVPVSFEPRRGPRLVQ